MSDPTPERKPASAPAPAPEAPRVAAPRKVTRFDPNATKARPQERSQAIAISPKTILLISLLIVIPTAIWLVKIGPVASFEAYQKLEPKIEMWMADTLSAVLNAEFKNVTFSEFVRPPKVTNVNVDSPIMMITLPEKVFVQGTTSEGHFKGHYFTKTQRIEVEVGLDEDTRTVNASGHVEGDRLVFDGYK